MLFFEFFFDRWEHIGKAGGPGSGWLGLASEQRLVDNRRWLERGWLTGIENIGKSFITEGEPGPGRVNLFFWDPKI